MGSVRIKQLAVPAAFAIAATATGLHAAGVVDHALAHPHTREWLLALYSSLQTGVAVAFAFFTVGRAAPRNPSRNPVAFAACAAAMGGAVAFGSPPASAPVAVVLAGDLVAVLSCAWLLLSVSFLGRCFGVLPEARGLVTHGPYKIVRHPVYLGEIGATVGLAIAAPTIPNALLLAVVIAVQFLRMKLEENALRAAFPEYQRYAETVPRVLPSVRASLGALGGGPDLALQARGARD
jgi:protein-S-isoprenylcysteine O-methyltransferase Ste14